MGIYSTSVIGLRLFLLWQKFVFVGKQEHPEKTADLPESSTKFMPESTDKYFQIMMQYVKSMSILSQLLSSHVIHIPLNCQNICYFVINKVLHFSEKCKILKRHDDVLGNSHNCFSAKKYSFRKKIIMRHCMNRMPLSVQVLTSTGFCHKL